MSSALEGKTIVVTGAGRGLGREYARLFAQEGARVAVVDIDETGSQLVADEITKSDGEAIAIGADVTDEASLAQMAERLVQAFGRVDVLVNNAGIWGDLRRVPLTEIEPEYFDLVLAVNLKGPLLCARALLPAMRARGTGRIINISSIGAYMPSGVYGVSKLALNQLTYALAVEVGGDGVTVNAIAPGTIDNEATRRQVPDAALASLLSRHAVKRAGTAQDVFGMIRYLASDEAEWVTGQTFLVNGGYSARL